MRLTTQTDFALRTLMYLAAISGRATISQVAGLFDISSHHVAKVVNQLARLGYLRSIRGIGGGIELCDDRKTFGSGKSSLKWKATCTYFHVLSQQTCVRLSHFASSKGRWLKQSGCSSITLTEKLYETSHQQSGG